MARKATEFVQFKLRIREGLRRKIESAAEKKDISANAEAVERLENSFDSETRRNEMRELASQFNKFIAESAELDRKTLKMMAGDKDENAMLLRILARELSGNPNWTASFESKKAFADRIHSMMLITNFTERGEA
jgi:hypothetical protein